MLWGYGSGAAGWWMVVESLIWAFVAVTIFAGVVLLLRNGFGNVRKSAREDVEERFTKGESDQDEINRC